VLKKIALTAAGFAAGDALTLVSVGYHAPTVAADEAEVAHMAAVKAQVMHTVYMLDKSGFHELDASLQAGTMPAGAYGPVHQARIAAQATEWPDTLKDAAATEIAQLQALEDALKNEDVDAAKDPAHQVHESGHSLSSKAYDWLSGNQTAAPMHTTDGDDHGAATPTPTP
jgi:hypothetical protein